jgi:hypothetical protein
MVEAAKVRDEALAEQAEAFAEALAENDLQLKESLADAQKELQKSLLDAQKQFDKAVADINKAMMKSLNELADKIREVIALLAALGVKTGGGGILGSIKNNDTSSYSTGLSPFALKNKLNAMDSQFSGTSYTINNNITGINLSRPEDTMNMVVGGIKYGTVVLTSGAGARLDEYAV